MNKTILIAGGAAVASLAVGTAGGYLFAKKRFNDSLPEIIEKETEAIKKHYSVMLMEAQTGKPASPADIPKQGGKATLLGLTETLQLVETHDESDGTVNEEDLTEADKRAMARGREHLKKAAAVLTDYSGISTEKLKEKTPAAPVESNIFDTAQKPKKKLPRRDDDTGKFRKPTAREAENEPPEIVDAEIFLQNDEEFDVESLLYFVRDKTLVLEADPAEAVSIGLVHEVNLTLFPETPEDQPCMIFVRNTTMKTMYEVKLMRGSLTDYLGLGEESGDDDEYPAASL